MHFICVLTVKQNNIYGSISHQKKCLFKGNILVAGSLVLINRNCFRTRMISDLIWQGIRSGLQQNCINIEHTHNIAKNFTQNLTHCKIEFQTAPNHLKNWMQSISKLLILQLLLFIF